MPRTVAHTGDFRALLDSRDRDAGRRRQMREQGYTDGSSGRPARWVDADYQSAWRRGREARNARKEDDDRG